MVAGEAEHGSDRVALVTNLRDAFVSWSADSLQLTLPTYFGRHQWTVPIDQVVAGDPTSGDISVVEDIFADPLVLPYLFTTGPGKAPNLVLLFRTRQRIPPMKRWAAVNSVGLPFRVWDTRSPEGVHLDGVILRAKDPTGALRCLGGAGVEIVTAPWAWLRAHRSVVTDPIERTSASKHLSSLAWQGQAGWMLLLVGGAALWWGQRDEEAVIGWLVYLGLICTALGVAFLFIVRRRETRRPK